jgi:hypothetical protein
MSALRHRLWAALAIALLCVPCLLAQSQNQNQGQSPSQDQSQPQDQSETPIPAYHSPFASAADNGNANSGDQNLTPDTHSLAGAQGLSLGLPESRTYWQAAANVSSTATSNGLGAASGWTSYTNLLGGLTLHDIAGRSDLDLSYLGGGLISNDGGVGNGVIQELGLVEKLSWRRATLSLLDQSQYLPEAGFGYAGAGGLALPGGNPVELQPGLTPNGTILTTRGQQLENSSIAELDTVLSPRSSWTILGGYSLLHFFGNNLLDVNDTIVQTGYNRDLTRKDTIAVLYQFSAFRFTGNSQTINNNSVQVSYARRVTGRLAFRVAAGPEFSSFGTPVVTGSGSTSGTPTGSLLTYSLNTALTYQLGPRSQLDLSYVHAVGGGAGVFTGSIADTATGSLSHRLTQTLSATITTGYARNHALSVPGLATVNQSYNYWLGGVTLSQAWGRAMNMFLSYQAEYQNSNSGFCVGPTCGTSVTINLISVGLNWRARPIAF